MGSEAEEIIKNENVQVSIEIIAEVIYVLKGYGIRTFDKKLNKLLEQEES